MNVEGVYLELSLESCALTNSEHTVKETGPGGGTPNISVNKTNCSGGRARIVWEYPSKYSVLRVARYVSIELLAGELRKNLQLGTPVFIYRRTNHP